MSDELADFWRDVRAPPPERIYRGTRENGKCRVTVQIGERRPTPLKLCKGILNHSPNGFEWSYSGSGPAQLALAILVDAFRAKTRDEKERAIQLHQAFKSAVIVSLPANEWTLTHGKVLEVVARLEGQPGVMAKDCVASKSKEIPKIEDLFVDDTQNREPKRI